MQSAYCSRFPKVQSFITFRNLDQTWKFTTSSEILDFGEPTAISRLHLLTTFEKSDEQQADIQKCSILSKFQNCTNWSLPGHFSKVVKFVQFDAAISGGFSAYWPSLTIIDVTIRWSLEISHALPTNATSPLLQYVYALFTIRPPKKKLMISPVKCIIGHWRSLEPLHSTFTCEDRPPTGIPASWLPRVS